MWKFKFPNYVSESSIHLGGWHTYKYRTQLSFVSYWLIRWIHGPDRLVSMSAETYLNKEFKNCPDTTIKENG